MKIQEYVNKLRWKITKIIYVHSSDIMMPSKFGISTPQAIIASRIIDTEYYMKGERPYYHGNMFEKSGDITKRMTNNYVAFLNDLEREGYSMAMSHSFITTKPLLMSSEGTHRIGYLLSKFNNVFLPVKVLSESENPYDIYGEKYFLNRLRRPEDWTCIKERFEKHYDVMNRSISGYLNKKWYIEHRNQFEDIASRYGSLEMLDEICITKLQKRKMKKCGVVHGKMDDVILFRIKVDANTLHKRNNFNKFSLRCNNQWGDTIDLNYFSVYSEEMEKFRLDMRNINNCKKSSGDRVGFSGNCWGGCADSITCSVLFENSIRVNSANKRKRK